MYSKEDLINFIKDCCPKFEKVNSNYKMFTFTTQWISNESINELLEHGIECYKKYGADSTPLQRGLKFINDKEIPKFNKDYSSIDPEILMKFLKDGFSNINKE